MNAVLKSPVADLRPMLEQDLEAVMVIERQVYPFPWTHGILHDCLRVGYACWVMEVEGGIGAYGIMSVGAGEAHILNLCTEPSRQRLGFGRRMLRHLLVLARKRGVETVLLEVRPSNLATLALYQDMGFNEVGMRRAYYPLPHGREDAMILALELAVADLG